MPKIDDKVSISSFIFSLLLRTMSAASAPAASGRGDGTTSSLMGTPMTSVKGLGSMTPATAPAGTTADGKEFFPDDSRRDRQHDSFVDESDDLDDDDDEEEDEEDEEEVTTLFDNILTAVEIIFCFYRRTVMKDQRGLSSAVSLAIKGGDERKQSLQRLNRASRY